jgi:hypothetical protein
MVDEKMVLDEEVLNSSDELDNSWEEKDVERDESFEEVVSDDEFSIGDSMLARGPVVEGWKGENLENVVDWNEVKDFGEEEIDEGFSYDVGSGSGDLYGAVSGGDLYGAGKSGGDLYGTGSGGSDLYNGGSSGGSAYDVSGGNMYNDGGKPQGEAKMYEIGKMRIKSQAQVEDARRAKRSGLESGLRRAA